MAPQKHRVWRCQRSRPNGDVVSCMTHDRKLALHFRIDHEWHVLFDGRYTFYGVAVITALHGEPRLKILRESTEEDWK
jgi:hypothetical protein